MLVCVGVVNDPMAQSLVYTFKITRGPWENTKIGVHQAALFGGGSERRG